jgi:repressor of nif and glnA expression
MNFMARTREMRQTITEEDLNKLSLKLKNEIISLSESGFSVRMIEHYFNDLYSKKNNVNLNYSIISRETIRKIIKDEPVSLKILTRNIQFLNF